MERIIILRSAVLGDFIISSPAMNLIREKHPNAKIYLFTIQSAHKKDRNAVKIYEEKKSLPWLEYLDNKIVDEIIPMAHMDFRYIFGVLRPIVKGINPTKCYILTDPLVKWKGNLAKFLLIKILGVKCPIFGWKDYVRNDQEKKNANEETRCINHTLSCLESVFEDKSIEDKEIVVKFPIVVSIKGDKEAEEIWGKFDLHNKKVFVVSPGGIRAHKIWPVINYIEVIKSILSEDRAEIILTGTKADIKIGEKIEELCGSERVHNLIGETNLMTLAAILKRANMLIGNDGGTMHIGDAVGCTVVAIMPGLELPKTVEPWHNMINSIRCNVPCAPCYNFDNCPNGTYACMRNITVSSVIETLKNADKNKKKHNEVRVSVNRDGKNPLLRILRDGT